MIRVNRTAVGFRGPVAFRCALPILLVASLLQGGASAPSYGHRPYNEAPTHALTDAGVYRTTGRIVRLRPAAAEAFRHLVNDAQRDGISIIPISGFRTVAYQRSLFERAVQRRGSPRNAARWVAPPGHSEHHTGWTLDLGDETRPTTDVDTAFASTPAFVWLVKNAARHGFELSFPKNNPHGVSYEPWHWRFVGSGEAQRLFHTR